MKDNVRRRQLERVRRDLRVEEDFVFSAEFADFFEGLDHADFVVDCHDDRGRGENM